MKGSRPFSKEEIDRIKKHFTGTGSLPIRNRALFILGANTGFRISELLSLTLDDLIEETGAIKDRVTVARRNIKGNKSGRTVLLNQAGKTALLPWLLTLRDLERIHKSDYIFVNLKVRNRAISRKHAWKIFKKTYRAAGLTGKLGTHAMRKTFANNVYSHFLKRASQGEQIDAFRATSKSLGHTDIKSTDQYLSFLTEDIDKTIEAVGV